MLPFFAIAISLLAVAYFLFLLFCFIGWKKTISSDKSLQKPTTKVSIVVAARNEAKNIKSCIEAALQQNYPSHLLQLIVVDDDSTDNTFQIATSMKNEFSNLAVIKSKPLNKEKTSFKKHAIQQGIDMANGNLIVTHDADCMAQPEWISTLVSCYETTQAKAIAMPIQFHGNNSWLTEFQQQDISGIMAITAGSIYFNMPLMANAANMAFEKAAFETVNGFIGNEKVPGGDDIFLLLKIKKAFTSNVIVFLKDEKAIVSTKACDTFQDFFQQRIRWVSKTGKFNNVIISSILMLSFLFNVSLLSALVFSIFSTDYFLLKALAVIYIFKWLIEYLLVSSGAKLLQHRFNIFQFLVCNVLHQLYVIIFGCLSMFMSFKWKGRTY